MRLSAFSAVCPAEIGDRVIAKQEGNEKTIYLILPDHKIPNAVKRSEEWRALLENGKESVITDIAAVHFCRSGQIQFQYELDNSGVYETLIVKIPVTRISDELERLRR